MTCALQKIKTALWGLKIMFNLFLLLDICTDQSPNLLYYTYQVSKDVQNQGWSLLLESFSAVTSDLMIMPTSCENVSRRALQNSVAHNSNSWEEPFLSVTEVKQEGRKKSLYIQSCFVSKQNKSCFINGVTGQI